MRSADWFSGNIKDSYIHRAWMRRGNSDSAFTGTRPQIAILNTASDLTPYNMHLDEVAQSVKIGIWEAGGVPHNLPVLSLGETNLRPTAMLWRNLAAMAAEEMIRGNPIIKFRNNRSTSTDCKRCLVERERQGPCGRAPERYWRGTKDTYHAIARRVAD